MSQKILHLSQFYAMNFLPFLFYRLGKPIQMVKPFKSTEILENLTLLSDWLRVKYPDDRFELIVVGGAAMALDGFKEQTTDIDLLRPEVLPASIANGIAHISRINRLGPEWLNSNVANMLQRIRGPKGLPDYFNEISQTIKISENLKIGLIGRQALISLKLLATTPSYIKHTVDIKNLSPTEEEITEAVRFVLDTDNTTLRKDDLRFVLKDMGCDLDEIDSRLSEKDE